MLGSHKRLVIRGVKVHQFGRNSVKVVLLACAVGVGQHYIRANENASGSDKNVLRIQAGEKNSKFEVYRDSGAEPILTQVALPDERPYIHPIVAPDGHGIITEYRPAHHPHQTGIFWGLKLVNGRDFFMKWQGDYYRRVSAHVLRNRGEQVKWQSVYDMLDETGDLVITETQNWSMRAPGGKYLLDLEWAGRASKNVTMGKYYVGGLFVRMPWHQGVRGEVVNAAGQRNGQAEAQPARWTDVGIQLQGRDDLAHIAIFDHPKNTGFPNSWRVDTQLGIGPSRQITGDWKIEKGKTERFRYRLMIYTGQLDPAEITREWQAFAKQD
jgi:hypothetical protein